LRERETTSKLKSEPMLLSAADWFAVCECCDLADAIANITCWNGMAGAMVCTCWIVEPAAVTGLAGAGAGLTGTMC
jgi:hypothetical protein